MEPGVLGLDVVDIGGGAVLLLDQAADLAAGLRPGLHLGRVATQEAACRLHGVSLITGRRAGPAAADAGRRSRQVAAMLPDGPAEATMKEPAKGGECGPN